MDLGSRPSPFRLHYGFSLGIALLLGIPVEASQDHDHPPSSGDGLELRETQHEHVISSNGWTFMQDGMVFVTFNRQAKPMGSTEFGSQNWWMGMASRAAGSGTVTVRGMLSLEPLTLGGDGYSEIFQTGETYKNEALTNRQHPHDLGMQLTMAWRLPLSHRTSITVAGGPVGEATLGPVAFMH